MLDHPELAVHDGSNLLLLVVIYVSLTTGIVRILEHTIVTTHFKYDVSYYFNYDGTVHTVLRLKGTNKAYVRNANNDGQLVGILNNLMENVQVNGTKIIKNINW